MGERLRLFRTQNHLSRKELATLAGVNIASIIQIEHGDKYANIEALVKICEELNCSVEFMLTGKCGITELIHLNQRILNIPNLPIENLKRIAHAFWSTCPKKHS